MMTSIGLRQSVEDSLDSVAARLATSGGILLPLRDLSNLATSARRDDPEHALEVLEQLVFDHRRDPLLEYMAIHALGGVPVYRAAEVITTMLSADHPGAREHAAWALSGRRPHLPALTGLVALAGEGGFARMTAELALEAWFNEVPELVWRPEVPADLRWLAQRPTGSPTPLRPSNGLRIAQILIQGRVDAGLTSPGSGDGGGLITLQVGLTRELAQHSNVAEVFLVGRQVADSGAFSRPLEPIVPGGTIARLDFGPDAYLTRGAMWEHRAELERRLRRFLQQQGPFDAVHLRFADVGTFAAARVADELGIPVFFTLAPDPHALIARKEKAGELTRANFGLADHEQHLIFKAWLVEHMLERAARVALLPRVGQETQLKQLLDVDISASPGRFSVIPEGVDLELVSRARQEVVGGAAPDVIVDLTRAIADLPESRHGLPLLLSVGRLAAVKGMDRVVAAWADDESVRSRFNLVLVGGDLDHPSPEEESVLAAIAGALPGGGEDSSGLVLLGGRSHSDVSRVMAATAVGVGPEVGACGVYVAGSEKEEFGLAIVEALAAGLPVVAPKVGGPGTYVKHGVTGYLADTTNVDDLTDGIHWADSVRKSELRAKVAMGMVCSRYSMATMADRLVDLYSMSDVVSTAL